MGASHVRGLVAEGVKVIIGGILNDDGKRLEEELGPPTLCILDVTKDDDWKCAVAAAVL